MSTLHRVISTIAARKEHRISLDYIPTIGIENYPLANEKDRMGYHGLINHLVGITRQQKAFTGPPASEYVVQ
jgi:hypothetical protein